MIIIISERGGPRPNIRHKRLKIRPSTDSMKTKNFDVRILRLSLCESDRSGTPILAQYNCGWLGSLRLAIKKALLLLPSFCYTRPLVRDAVRRKKRRDIAKAEKDESG